MPVTPVPRSSGMLDSSADAAMESAMRDGNKQQSMQDALQLTLCQVTDCSLQLEDFSRQQRAMQMALWLMTTEMQDSMLLMEQQ